MTGPLSTSPAAQVDTTVKIDIWSDIACPWCYVGKRRLETALSRLEERGFAPQVEIEYHSFELSPDTPVDFDGSSADFLAKHKGMPRDQVDTMLAQMTELAAAEGLSYDFDAVHQTKTLSAHELLHLAKSHGKQAEMKERLLKAYFEEGAHVGRADVLVDLAVEVGLDRDEVTAALADGRYADDVQADIDQAHAYGINGVPFFVVDGRYGVSGAQDPAVFVQVLEQAAAEGAAA
ncbi:DsbA family oxidoreductase [Cellulosimicrobium terreum]|nr:DsbA family oxidoreductase [Cellulosimicrobium terreum]